MDAIRWAPDDPTYNAFFQAASEGNAEEMKAILDVHPQFDINILKGDGVEGKTALHIASTAGHAEVVKILLASGADVNHLNRDTFGCSTPLHGASLRGCVHVVRLLLDNGADVNARDESRGTALHEVARNWPPLKAAHIETVMLLLDHGLDLDIWAGDMGGTGVSKSVIVK